MKLKHILRIPGITRYLWARLSSRIVQDSAWVMASSFCMMGSGILLSIALTRIISPFQYGLIILAMTVVDIVSEFAGLSIGEALMKFAVDYRAANQPGKAWQLFRLGLAGKAVLGLAIFLLLMTLAPFLSLFFRKGDDLTDLMRIYCFVALLRPLDDVLQAILTMFMQFKRIALWQSFVAGAKLALPVLFATRGSSGVILGFVFAQVLGSGLLTGFTVQQARREFAGVQPSRIGYQAKEILAYSFHSAFSSSIRSLWQYVDVLIIGIFRPPQEVSYYRIGRSAAMLLQSVSVPIKAVIYPRLCAAWTGGDRSRVRDIITRFSWYLALMVLPAAAGMFVFASPIVGLMYTPAYQPVAKVLRIMLWGSAATAIAGWQRSFAFATGHGQLCTYLNLSVVVALAAGGFLLAPRWGYIGASGVYTITFLIAALFWFLMAKVILGRLR